MVRFSALLIALSFTGLSHAQSFDENYKEVFIIDFYINGGISVEGRHVKETIKELSILDFHITQLKSRGKFMSDYVFLIVDSIADCVDYDISCGYAIAINKENGSHFRLQGFENHDIYAFLDQIKEKYKQNGRYVSRKYVAKHSWIEGLELLCKYQLLATKKLTWKQTRGYRYGTCLRRVSDEKEFIIY